MNARLASNIFLFTGIITCTSLPQHLHTDQHGSKTRRFDVVFFGFQTGLFCFFMLICPLVIELYHFCSTFTVFTLFHHFVTYHSFSQHNDKNWFTTWSKFQLEISVNRLMLHLPIFIREFLCVDVYTYINEKPLTISTPCDFSETE